MSMGAYAQVGPPQATNPNTNNGYGFTQSTGTYTPLSAGRTIWQSGTTLGTDAVSAAINLPSPFKYNGKSYSAVYISNNGFVTLGTPALSNTYTGLSTDTSTPYEGAFAGFATNLRHANTTTSEISYETVGSNFIVQFTDLQGSSAAAAQTLNFQIQFDLTSNNVNIVYGNCVSGTASLTGQVGIRGSEASDINNRVGTDWSATAIGTSATVSCTLGTTNGTTVPASGLTFTFTPGTWLSTPATYATLPFTENFGSWVNGNSTADLPNAANWRTWPSRGDNSWRASDISVSGFSSVSGWTSVGGTSTIGTPAVAPTARFHSYNTVNASGYMDLYINLSGGTGNRILSFNYYNSTGTDNLKIQLSTDGGTTFNTVGSTFGVSSSWATRFVDLGSSSATAVVRFLATGDNGDNDIYVDNVNVSVVTCLMPDTVTVGTSTATTESVNWTIGTPAPSYDIYYSTTNTAPTSTSTPNVTGATGTTNTLTNLTPLTTYYVWVRSHCSSSDQSIWIAGPSFTTKTFCPTVSVPSSSATGVSVTPTFTWTANADATGYKLSIGTTAGGTNILNSFDMGNVNTYVLPFELSYNTKYYYTVNSYNATQTSTGCTERNFTTLSICPTVSVPAASAIEVSLTPTFTWSAVTGVNGYKLRIGTTAGGNDVLDNVDVGNVTTYTLPTPLNNSTVYYYSVGAYTATQNSINCTERNFTTLCSAVTAFAENFDGVAAGSWPACWGKVGTTGTASIVANTAMSGPNVLNISASSTTSLPVVKMRPVSTLDTGLYRLRFKARSSSTVGGKVEVGYLTNPAAASSFVNLATFTTTSTSVADNFSVNNITAPAGTTILAFRHTGSPSNAVLVDDVVYELMPSCMEPSAIIPSSPTVSGVNLAWTAPTSAPANGYDIYYSTVNTAPTSTSTPNITGFSGTSTPISGLASGTAYYIWVRSRCSSSDQSIWVSSAFTTVTLPPVNDDCSSAVSLVVGGTFAQNVVTGTTVASTNTPALTASCLTTTTNVAGNVWYKVVVPASGNITIETDTSTGTALTDTVISVFADCTSTTSIGCDDDSGNDAFSKLSLTGQTPGATLYVSVWRYSNLGGGSDGTFKISAYDASLLGTSEVAASKNTIKVYPNPFADVLNISDVSKVKSISIIDLSGRIVKTIDNPSSSLQLGDLKEGMYLVTLHMKDGSKQTIKAIKK